MSEEPMPVLVELRESVAYVTLSSPDGLNLMNRELLEALLAALEGVANDDDAKVVVLTGAGRAFCAGGDLTESLSEITGSGSLSHQTAELRRLMRTTQLLAEMEKPTIASVNGACAGGALGLACGADIRVASTTAVFTTAFVSVGVSGDFGGTWGLSRAVGPGLAREMYLTGRRVGADEALRRGLVSFVYPPEHLAQETERLATALGGQAPLAMRAIKDNFNSLPASLAEVLEYEAKRHVRCTATSDAEEARRAFLEKRSPTFRGR
jgi:2-(1,2-epoxy-1,2-dihydrophenyl)acetyl-CoA isomerase